jgi:hypothetical protein
MQNLRYLIKTSLINIYHHHDLINCYIISVSQMTTDMFATTGARTHDLPHSIDNTMAKRKRTNHDLQNTTRKTKNRATPISLKNGKGWIQVFRKGKQFLFHSRYKLSDMSWMRKGQDCDYIKRNISVVGSSPGSCKPKTIKLVFVASPLNTQNTCNIAQKVQGSCI